MTVMNTYDTAPDFHIVVDANADPPCVAVSGEIDLVTCAAFRDALTDAVEAATRVIVVDVARVTFIGSTGIRELVRALETVDRVEIHGPAPIVRRALESAGLGHSLRITGD